MRGLSWQDDSKVMNNKLKISILALVSYLFFLIVAMPASQVNKMLGDKIPLLSLPTISGTVWSGAATHAQVGSFPLDQIRWDLRIFPLLAGQLVFDFIVKGGDTDAEGTAGFSINGLETINDLRGDVPAELLMQFNDAQVGTLKGVFSLSVNAMQFSENTLVEADGSMLWRKSGFQNPIPMNLGDLMITLMTENKDDRVHMEITDQEGPVDINVNVYLYNDGKYEVKGTASPSKKADANTVSTLKLIGRPGPKGQILINYESSL